MDHPNLPSQRGDDAIPISAELAMRLFRKLYLRSRIPYSVVRRFARLALNSCTYEREIERFRMRLTPLDVLQTRLLLDGVWEPAFTRWWAYLSTQGHTIIDIGAHCGYYSLFARSVSPTCVIHAFEPNPLLQDDFRRNVQLNSYDGIELIPQAITAHQGETDLYVRDIEPAAGSIHRPHVYDRRLTVGCTTLDSYVTEHRIEVVDLVKMDIEGGEANAIAGMQVGLAQGWYGALLMEVHKILMPEGQAESLRQVLAAHGYTLYRIKDVSAEPLLVDGAIPDFDQWLALSPHRVEKLKLIGRAGGEVILPGKFATIYEGIRWQPAGRI
jgi:FkbM family methyltransferase